MRMPTIKRKPRKHEVTSFPAPTGGLVSNRNLAMSRGPDMPPAAAVLENYFPTATGVVVRRGRKLWASTIEDTPISSIFTYISGSKKQMFAANDSTIWDITSVASPMTYALTTEEPKYISPDIPAELVFGESSLEGLDVVTGNTSGDWSVVQFSTSGGDFIVGVNGEDDAFIYDGTNFADTAITFPSGVTLTTADLSHVWVYKNRIWFIEKDSVNAWYLPVDSIGGELTLWPMGGVFDRGGVLMWGQSWSLDSGGSGGLSEQCVFCTTEGEVAAYQGLSPEVDQGWGLVGVYRIGRPLGKKAFFRAGGDIGIATTVGLISLSTASRQDFAALGQNAISYPIEDDWVQAVQERGQDDWQCHVWADGQMLLVSPPTPNNRSPILYVANVNTGKWCTFTGWDATSIASFRGGLFFGSRFGDISQGWVSGSDNGETYSARCLPLFDNLNAPASLKTAKTARCVVLSAYSVEPQLSCHVNYRVNFPAPPAQSNIDEGSEWDVAIWGKAAWDVERGDIVTGEWVSVGGAGHDISVGAQLSSGSIVPSDAELVRIDLTYTTGQVGT